MTASARLAPGGAAVLLITGCLGLSPREDPSIFLVLAPGTVAVPMPAIARQDLRVGVGPVTLPRYLDRPQYVTRVDATEVTVNEYARWAGPLDQLVAEAVAENLAGYLALGAAVTHPWRRMDAPHYAVRLHLLHFEVTGADSASLAGRWEIADPQGTVIVPPRTAAFSRPAAAGPKGGAAALSDLLGLLSAEIAGVLRDLPAAADEPR